MRRLAWLFAWLAAPALASHGQMPACKTIDSDKTAAIYLVDAGGALSNGPIDVGTIAAPRDAVEDQKFYDTPFRIVATPKAVNFTDSCGQGICLKLVKTGRACKGSTVYAVRFAITLTGKPRVSPYALDEVVPGGFDFQGEEDGYPAPVDYKFVAKLRGTVVTVP